MGRNANWFRAVKHALGSECKEHKDQRSTKAKKKWFAKKKKTKSSPPISKSCTTASDNTTIATPLPMPLPLPLPPVAVEGIKQIPVIPCEKVKLKEEEEEEDEQKRHAESIAIATAKATEAAAAAAQAAAEVVRLTNAAPFPGKPKEDVAAVRIQTAFRAYLARRALCALRGLASLKIVMQGKCIKHATTATLKSMQSLARVQSQVRTRRLRMSEDNQGRRGHTLEKQVKELGKVEDLQRNPNDWHAIPKSKEQAEARVQSQHEASIRRDRALAYSSLNHHQKSWRNSSPTPNSAETVFLDINNRHSGWSWLERWLAARPWETTNNHPNKPEEDEEEDAKSVLSVLSDSDHDDDYKPAAHTHPLPSYMAPTQSSARAKKRPDNKPEATDRLSVCSAKNTRSRHSAASETDASSIAEHHNFVNVM